MKVTIIKIYEIMTVITINTMQSIGIREKEGSTEGNTVYSYRKGRK